MVKLFLKDNTDGQVHEYGTDPHDSLILQDDGSLHYHNLHNSTGTMFPKEGYSFCLENGEDPRESEECVCGEAEPYVNIGGNNPSDLSHVMCIEFTQKISAEHTGFDMVALFDDRIVSGEEVLKYIKNSYPMITRKDIVVMYKEQFEGVFKVRR